MDPFAAVALPAFMRDVLERCVEPLRSEETIYQAIAARAANLKDSDYERLIGKLKSAAEPYKESVAVVTPANDTARAWFIANGIPVIQ